MTRAEKAVAAYLATIGAKGGAATTPAKQAASRANGKVMRRRYCPMCDVWIVAKHRTCPMCGADTDKEQT